jgi:hypothetical protein
MKETGASRNLDDGVATMGHPERLPLDLARGEESECVRGSDCW